MVKTIIDKSTKSIGNYKIGDFVRFFIKHERKVGEIVGFGRVLGTVKVRYIEKGRKKTKWIWIENIRK